MNHIYWRSMKEEEGLLYYSTVVSYRRHKRTRFAKDTNINTQ